VKGLLLDVAGTLLSPSEKMTDVYTRYGAPYGVRLSEREMLRNFRRAYNEPWTHAPIRYVGDGKDFWHKIVSTATGCADHAFFDEVYEYYARAEAWKVAPGAEEALRKLRRLGVKLAIVSNFDTRLRPLLDDMNLTPLFDAVVVSAEVSAEKPNPVIFSRAVELLALEPADCVHVGDDRRNDLWGARDAGCHALLWGYDVKDMTGVVDWVVHGEHDT
jgi:REG-2-like HAD superfamily hydrolase